MGVGAPSREVGTACAVKTGSDFRGLVSGVRELSSFVGFTLPRGAGGSMAFTLRSKLGGHMGFTLPGDA